MTNPLVAEPTGVSGLAGLGIAADIHTIMGDNEAWEFGVDGLAIGLDMLSLAVDPFGALASGGVNWVLQHVDFLREPLEQLTGDADAVQAIAATWANVAQALTTAAEQYVQDARAVAGWTGEAADHYRAAGDDFAKVLAATAQHAHDASVGITAAGILIATERGIVFDMISKFVGRLIVEALAALAASWCTFGASIGAFLVAVDVDAAIQAETFSLRMGRLVSKLAKFAQRFTTMGSKAQQLLKQLDKASARMRSNIGLAKGRKTLAARRLLAGHPGLDGAASAQKRVKDATKALRDVTGSLPGKAVRGGAKAYESDRKERESAP